jgi:hypothetical protein
MFTQNVFVEINENGTEAAACTSADLFMFRTSNLPPSTILPNSRHINFRKTLSPKLQTFLIKCDSLCYLSEKKCDF